MKYSVGMKVRVTQDCRDLGDMERIRKTGQIGTYVGDVNFLVGDLEGEHEFWPMPKIEFEGGDIIYGCECWWEPIEDNMPPLEISQIALEEYKAVVRKTLLGESDI